MIITLGFLSCTPRIVPEFINANCQGTRAASPSKPANSEAPSITWETLSKVMADYGINGQWTNVGLLFNVRIFNCCCLLLLTDCSQWNELVRSANGCTLTLVNRTARKTFSNWLQANERSNDEPTKAPNVHEPTNEHRVERNETTRSQVWRVKIEPNDCRL